MLPDPDADLYPEPDSPAEGGRFPSCLRYAICKTPP
jgi:hypothetical protein